MVGSRLVMAVAAVLLGGVAVAQAAPQTGYLYVSDYGQSTMERYTYTWDPVALVMSPITPYGIGGNTTNAYFLGSAANPIKEGVHGTLNDLIIVGGNHGTGVTNITRFALDGSFIGSIPINFSAYNGGNVGIGNVLVTPDGKYLYAPLETAGQVVKVDLSNGAIVASYAYAGAHDIALAANGTVYVSNYNASSAAIIALDANLTAGSRQTLVTAANSGVAAAFRPSGLSIASDGSLYVNNNARGGPDSVLHYAITDTGGTLTANLNLGSSYIGSASLNALAFTFGNNFGPDGNLYIAALGGGGSGTFGITSGYVDGIYKYNPTTQAVARAIGGYTETGGGLGASGLSAPKYLQFSTNFVTVNDVGFNAPEPSAAVLLVGGLAGLGALRRRLGRRRSA